MELESIMLSETSQTEKDLTYMWNLNTCGTPETNIMLHVKYISIKYLWIGLRN